MDVETYRKRKVELERLVPRPREVCPSCRQPGAGCYCAHVRRFDPGLRFVILIHPIEARRRIATGRMSHLCLERSILLEGEDFSGDARLDRIVGDPRLRPFVLYPGRDARNLSRMTREEKISAFDGDREPVIVVIDGTWATARKMMRSTNLRDLPRVCFSPTKPSSFHVRKQPAPGCLSTIEAIHETIEHLDGIRGVDVSSRAHEALLSVFDAMVVRQLGFVSTPKATRPVSPKRRIKSMYAALGSQS